MEVHAVRLSSLMDDDLSLWTADILELKNKQPHTRIFPS